MERVIRGVIFDLDGLMIDSERLSLSIWRKLLAQYGMNLTQEQYEAMIGADLASCAAHVIKVTGLGMDRHDLAARHMAVLSEAVSTSAEAQPGLNELMIEIKQRGLRTGIASNSPCHYIDGALTAIGLRDAFDCIVSIEDVPDGKPAPDVYLAAAARLGLTPEECLALEDSALGLVAAHRAGMKCVLVPTPGQSLEAIDFPHARYCSLTELTAGELDFLLDGEGAFRPDGTA